MLFSFCQWVIGDEPDERRKEVLGQGGFSWVGKERGPSFFFLWVFNLELVNTGCL